VTRRASAEVEAARALDAEKLAPYWFRLATEYLHQARYEAAHSDFQAANRFGRRSAEAAITAQKMAKERALEPGASDEAPIDPSTEPPAEPVRRQDGEAVRPLPAPEDE
jgi:hypothetical protein